MTAWTRSRTPSFRRRLETCDLTVASLTTTVAAISALERPLARSLRISTSRPVSDATAAVSFGGGLAGGVNRLSSRSTAVGPSRAFPFAITRIASMSSAGRTSLRRKPLAPARTAP
jgi:hypothetical protein